MTNTTQGRARLSFIRSVGELVSKTETVNGREVSTPQPVRLLIVDGPNAGKAGAEREVWLDPKHPDFREHWKAARQSIEGRGPSAAVRFVTQPVEFGSLGELEVVVRTEPSPPSKQDRMILDDEGKPEAEWTPELAADLDLAVDLRLQSAAAQMLVDLREASMTSPESIALRERIIGRVAAAIGQHTGMDEAQSLRAAKDYVPESLQEILSGTVVKQSKRTLQEVQEVAMRADHPWSESATHFSRRDEIRSALALHATQQALADAFVEHAMAYPVTDKNGRTIASANLLEVTREELRASGVLEIEDPSEDPVVAERILREKSLRCFAEVLSGCQEVGGAKPIAKADSPLQREDTLAADVVATAEAACAQTDTEFGKRDPGERRAIFLHGIVQRAELHRQALEARIRDHALQAKRGKSAEAGRGAEKAFGRAVKGAGIVTKHVGDAVKGAEGITMH